MKLFYPIKPKAAPRPRVTKNGTYNSKEYTQYKNGLAMLAKTRIKEPTDKPVYMKIEFFFKIPKSWNRLKRETAKWHTGKPDIDNLQKAIKDALNGVAYKDDSQVCFVKARKQYAQDDGVLVEVIEC